jgi:hypothetical protein
MRNFITFTLHEILSGDQINEDGMGRALRTNGR